MGEISASRRAGSGFYAALLFVVAAATVLAILQEPEAEPRETSFSLRDLRSWTGWLHPVEFNPSARLPYVSESLWGIALSPDGTRIWVRGKDGELMQSSDNGVTWLPVGNAARPGRVDEFLALDNQTLWGSRNNSLRHSRDGGKTWERIDFPKGLESAVSLRQTGEGERIWVLDARGGIASYSPRDGSWSGPVALARTRDLGKTCRATSFAETGAGLAVCQKGVFRRSADGEWKLLSTPKSTSHGWGAGHLSADGRRIVLVGDDGMVAVNAGNDDWSTVALSSNKGVKPYLAKIDFDSSGSRGYVSSTSDELFSLDIAPDGKIAWEQLADGETSDFAVAADRKTWRVSSSASIYRSEDGGRHWRKLTLGEAGAFRRIERLPQDDGLLVLSASGRILSSDRRGRAFSESLSLRGEKPYDMDIGRHGKIWVAGERGFIASGRTAAAVSPGRQEYRVWWSVRFSEDGSTGYVGGDDGVMRRTLDGGKTWKRTGSFDQSVLELFIDPPGRRVRAVANGGFVLGSDDGGETWHQAQLVAPKADLHSVWYTSDLSKGWVAGERGIIMATVDGGRTWRQQNSSTPRLIYRIRFHSDGLRGWAAGDHGTLLRTADGGATWLQSDTRTSMNLRDVTFSDDGERVWAVGWGGTILLSEDAGRSWIRLEGVEGAKYRKLPAPWYWALLLALGSILVVHGRRLDEQAEDRMLSHAVSDSPISDPAEDRFKFNEIARAVSLFIRNANTVPPFTIAVSGPWGSGKSSIMQLLRADLARSGCSSVWFNAWHYQDEATALASLTEHIRRQALPPGFSTRNLFFRARLLFSRVPTLIWVLLIFLAGAAVAMAWLTLVERHVGLARLAVETLSAWADSDSVKYWLSGLSLGGLFAAYRALQAFSPGSGLLQRAWRGLTAFAGMASLGEDPGVRYRFARQLSETVDALAPLRLVIIIDDLDRCHPERVANVLETVNFLVSSANCFVVLGVDLDRVLDSLGVAFDRVSRDYQGAPGSARSDEGDRRKAFAVAYLRKLVNLEVRVPRSGLEVHQLLFEQEPVQAPSALVVPSRSFLPGLRLPAVAFGAAARMAEIPQRWRSLTSSVSPSVISRVAGEAVAEAVSGVWNLTLSRRSALIVACALIALAGWYSGEWAVLAADQRYRYREVALIESAPEDTQVRARVAPVAPVIPPTPSAPDEPSVTRPSRGQTLTVIAAQTDSGVPVTSVVSGLFALILISAWRIYRGAMVGDSKAFRRAIENWSARLSAHLVTPREMKRFINRVRYAATRLRVSSLRPRARWLERVGAGARGLLGLPSRRDDPDPNLDEETLVRLAAYAACGGNLEELGQALPPADPGPARLRELDPTLAASMFDEKTIEQRQRAIATFNAVIGSVRY